MGIQINGSTDTISASDGGLIVSGAELPAVININATGIVTATSFVIGAGSTASPSLAPSGDSNTGIFFPAADTIAFAEGGVEAARFDSSGRLGIGTNNPAEQLELNAGLERLMIGANSPSTYSRIAARNTANSGYRGLQIDGSDLLINSNTSGNIVACTGGGSMGIGTASPSQKFEVVGGEIKAGRVDASQEGGQVSFARATDNATGWYLDVYGSTSTPSLRFVDVSNAAVRASFDGSGRFLVGANSSINDNEAGVGYPNRVQIESSSANQGLTVRNIGNVSRLNIVRLQDGMTSNTHVGYLGFGAHVASGPSIERARVSAFTDTSGGAGGYGGRLSFEVAGDGSAGTTIRLSIFRDGITEISGTFRPTADNSYNLGGSGQRWASVFAANGTINTSDGREKTEISNSTLGLDFIKSLRPVSYKWIEGGKRETDERDENNNIVYESFPGQRTHWGFIAQEVKEAVDAAGVDFGGWILTDKDDPDSQQGLRYDQFIAPLTKALQEAMERIETLEAQNADFAARISTLEGN